MLIFKGYIGLKNKFEDIMEKLLNLTKLLNRLYAYNFTPGRICLSHGEVTPVKLLPDFL